MVVVDSDAALIVDPRGEWDDVLFVLEIANLQLLEDRTFDALLDRSIDRSYDDIGRLYRRPTLLRNVRRTVREISLLRIEIAELADATDNITKFLGDWYIARIYHGAKERFHLGDWKASVEERLLTLNKLYTMASDAGDTRRMIVLEAAIVLLFIIDLAVIVYLY